MHPDPPTDATKEAPAMPSVTEPSQFEKLILAGLQNKPVYEGTVDPAVTADRRRKNRAARKSRRINRKRSSR